MNSSIKYLIITPVRDEEAYIEKTLQSVLAQTLQPAEWVIVNDGSTDRTGAIIDAYAANHRWILTVDREDRGFRKAAGGVVEAFYEGLAHVTVQDWDFIVKLDGDLSFEKDYFVKCFEQFGANAKLGIGGGTIYHVINGALQRETTPIFHVRGATKIYRRQCWDNLAGLIRAPGWDTLDEVKANMLGWETRTFPDLRVLHHRPTGMADGTWRSGVKYGLANYISGYHPVFMIVKCLKRLLQRPYLIGSVSLMYGFLSGYAKKTPRVDDPTLISYLRREQLKRLFMKSSIWR
jgi:biofilm PGA synthesis N-glycosyltransferase PgaC